MQLPRYLLRALAPAALLAASTLASAQNGPPPQVLPEGIRGGSEIEPERGVEIRHYTFKPTGEQLPYAVYVSSKVRKDQKAPLIVALRGFTGTTLTLVRGTAVDLAEQGGYILVGVIGYNNRAGYGGPPPPPPAPPGAAPPPPSAGPPAPPMPRTLPPLVGGSAETDAAKVNAYSEQDVMNVLALVRQEFNIDDRRIYLMGHSQGGGGARHLAEKYSDIWAGVALLAPALFNVQLTPESKITHVPLLLAVGDQDSLLPSVHAFSMRLDELHVAHEYLEMPGINHGTVIMSSMPAVFRFFGKHVQPEKH